MGGLSSSSSSTTTWYFDRERSAVRPQNTGLLAVPSFMRFELNARRQEIAAWLRRVPAPPPKPTKWQTIKTIFTTLIAVIFACAIYRRYIK